MPNSKKKILKVNRRNINLTSQITNLQVCKMQKSYVINTLLKKILNDHIMLNISKRNELFSQSKNSELIKLKNFTRMTDFIEPMPLVFLHLSEVDMTGECSG